VLLLAVVNPPQEGRGRNGEKKEIPHCYKILDSVYGVEISVWILFQDKTLEALYYCITYQKNFLRNLLTVQETAISVVWVLAMSPGKSSSILL